MVSLVAGGAGFLGSHLVDALLAQGQDVIIADNLCTGSLRNIDAAILSGRATFVYVDLAAPAREVRQSILKAARSKPITRIFHLASRLPLSYDELSLDELSTIAVGTITLIGLALAHRAVLVYATRDTRSDRAAISSAEQDLANASTWGYEATRFGEYAVALAAMRRGLDARIVRLPEIYGPRMPSGGNCLISSLSRSILAQQPLPAGINLRETRSVLYVDDAVRHLLAAASIPQLLIAPIDISGDEEYTVLEIAELFARAAGAQLYDVHDSDGQHDRVVSRANSPRGTSGTTLFDGFRQTVRWLRDSAVQYV